MKSIKQKNSGDNPVVAVANYLLVSNIPVTLPTIKKIKYHPEYPSLLSISDAFNEWNIENATVNINASQLKEIPYPSIAYLTKGDFVVLTKLNGHQLTYIDPAIGEIEESLSAFESKWDGIVLLAEPNEKSGEAGYAEKKKQIEIERTSGYLLSALLICIVACTIPFLAIATLPIYLANLMGGVFTFLLLQKQFGLATDRLDAFCKMGKSTDCDAVINSPRAKIFGFHLSEIGAWFFLGNTLTITIGDISSVSVSSILFILCLLTLPISFLTIYYQAMVIKKNGVFYVLGQ